MGGKRKDGPATDRKGQIAVEFMAMLSIALVFFVVMQIFASEERAYTDMQMTTTVATRLTRSWVEVLDIAGRTDGFYYEMTAPGKVDYYGTNYAMTLSNYSVTVVWGDTPATVKTVSAPMQVGTLRNETSTNAFNVTPGNTYRINNVNGVVWVVKK